MPGVAHEFLFVSGQLRFPADGQVDGELSGRMVTVQLVDSPVALAVATVVLLAGRGPLTAALVLVLPPVVRGWTLEIWRALSFSAPPHHEQREGFG
jgi:hypothetical protein